MPADARQIDDFLALFDGNAEIAIQALKDTAGDKAREQRSKTDLPRSSEVILSVTQAVKRYTRGKQIINALGGISIDVYKGEFVALTGPSGSGKSTLLQMMGGLDKLSGGEVKIEGQSLSGFKDEHLAAFRNHTIGFIFQFFYLQPFLTLEKNIEVPEMFGNTASPGRHERVLELLETVGLVEQAEQLPKQLSGGQIQRAAVARALLNKPRILLADEPTGNLDSANSAGIIELFEHIRNTLGTTIVIVTHNPEIAARADREIRLSDGVLA